MNMFKLNTEERYRILNLHESVKEKTISEQTTNYKVADIQTWLNTNKKSGLVVDGKLGSKTAAAIKSALGVSTPVLSDTTTTTTTAGIQTPAGVQTPAGTTVASATDEPVDSLTV
jgi:peptidoglycan hydrolase-like protein with peptidoglycan-binding domain